MERPLMASRRLRRAKFKVATVCGAVVLVLAVAELAVRVLGVRADMPLKTLPVADIVPGELDGIQLSASAKRPGAVRIAFLGDSFTFGFGVRPDQNFVSKTGVLLSHRAGPQYAVVNLGKPGEDLIREWVIYDQLKDRVRPDVVVQVMTANDLDVDLYEDLKPIVRVLEERMWPSRVSQLFAVAETRIRWVIGRRRTLDYMRGGATPEARERSWRIVSHVVDATKQLVEGDGGVYVLVRFPFMVDLEDYALTASHQRTAALARQLGVPYLDLLDVLASQGSAKMCLPRDTHPTPEAHSLVARTVTDFLTREVLPKLERTATTQPAPMRPPDQIRAAAIQHYERILELDPTCHSAQLSLQRMQAQQPGPGDPSRKRNP